jgi:hypothetical protein
VDRACQFVVLFNLLGHMFMVKSNMGLCVSAILPLCCFCLLKLRMLCYHSNVASS